MEKNNKKRIIKLLNILRKESNEDKHLSLNELVSLLNKENIEVGDRKTLYDDIKTLNELDYDIEYDNGYYLLEAPFSLSEIKIIQDSINSLKNLDTKLLEQLNNKLYSFIGKQDVGLLEKLKYSTKHKDKKLLQRMEDILLAIKWHYGILVNHKTDVIYPLFIYRANDYYYFYYHYEDNDKIYHYRFDNINDIVITEKIDKLNINQKKLLDTIEASTNAYAKGKTELVSLIVNNPSSSLDQRIIDDFPNAIKTKNGYSLKANVNPLFFAKIAAYGTELKLEDEKQAHSYQLYLNDILAIYR